MKQNIERQSREARILSVAKRHFEQYGYKKTTIDGLVQEVGIAKGTFFLHFKTKEELLMAVYQQIRHETLGVFQTLMQQAQSPAQKVESLLRFALEQLDKQPLFHRLERAHPEFDLFRRILDLPDTQNELDQALENIRQLLRAGIACGEFRADLDLEILPYILGSLKFLMFHPTLITADGRITTARFIEGLVQLTMQGLRKEVKEHD